MQIEQNLFSIYRLILKTPKYIFILSLGFLLVIAVTQLASILTDPPPLDLSQCLLDYVLEKHAQGMNSTSPMNGTEGATNKSEQAKLDEYELLDDTTVLNVQIGSDCHYEIDYGYKFDKEHLPVMFLTKNEYLAYLEDRPQSYLKKHRITHDRLVVPDPHISTPFFAYFYHQDTRLNQFLIDSFQSSIISLDSKFMLYVLGQNLTNSKLTIKELYLTFYYTQGALTHQKTINMIQFINTKLLSALLVKFLIGVGMILILYLASMFVGLAIRYSLFLLYTIFLLAYDRCMAQSWGWVHQNLSILYSRFRQNRGTTIKFLLFYVLANIGMYGLLTLGSYCIIKKLYHPLFPFIVEQQTQFFFKSMFFVELFLYVICRSRTSLQFFPILSFTVTYLCIFLASVQLDARVSLLLNLNLTLQLILFTLFILIEQAIQHDNQKGMIGEYCPSFNKPRMLFYAGYDISWEKSMPPIWTYFTGWFDYSYFSEPEKCLIEKDYQLLYGRMLGLNERQEIPEYEREEQSERMGLREQPSNEMNLIQNDL